MLFSSKKALLLNLLCQNKSGNPEFSSCRKKDVLPSNPKTWWPVLSSKIGLNKNVLKGREKKCPLKWFIMSIMVTKSVLDREISKENVCK
jgi:hypothetical protein